MRGLPLIPMVPWLLDEAISLCKGLNDVLTYAEDPCGAEQGFLRS